MLAKVSLSCRLLPSAVDNIIFLTFRLEIIFELVSDSSYSFKLALNSESICVLRNSSRFGSISSSLGPDDKPHILRVALMLISFTLPDPAFLTLEKSVYFRLMA